MKRFVLVLAGIFSLVFDAVASDSNLKITAISADPNSLRMLGADDAPQLLVTGQRSDGRAVDLTAAVRYRVADPTIARVADDGRVYPLANGKTTITVTFENHKVDVSVTAEHMEAPIPINFGNQVVPVFTKLGCNAGGCHGKIQGQNGFRLSLLGFDPEFDYMTLMKEARGRRVFPAAPERSLILTKAIGAVPHGGGKKTEYNSEEYRLLRRWIASGMPFGSPNDPTVKHITVTPESRVLDQNGRQQLAVYAHYTDGTVEDVTRRALFESNETDVATVTDTGLVQTLERTGQAAIMVRYQGLVTVFRAYVPRPGGSPAFDFPIQTIVDQHTVAKWKELGIAPSELCTDEQFLRRASLDITGTIPTPDEIRQFVSDPDPTKRQKLIDRLLETPEYSYYFANKWADILRVKRRNVNERAIGTFAFHGWIREAMANDKPYDQFVREILCAVGTEEKFPPTVWYKEVQSTENFVDDVSQVFLGQRLGCANCHHHPYEKWSQDDYWGLAAFFARVGKKPYVTPGRNVQNNNQNPRNVIYVKSTGSVTNKRTNRPAVPTPLEGQPVDIPPEEDPRHTFVNWLTDTKNPFFARAVANRYWAHFFGRGIVDPLDDMRVTNPPSNPELLDALAQELVNNNYSLKSLIKTICKSRTYQLSSTPNEYNVTDKQSFARFYPRRLSAEVVYDAVNRVTNSPANFQGLPGDRLSPHRAIMLPDESFASYFLDVFGRPQRISACECERVNDASLAMSLHMINSEEVQGKLSRSGGRCDMLAKDPRPEAEKVEELFLWAIARKPNPEQLQTALDHISKKGSNKKVAYENILWALLNSKAFLFNQ